MKNRINKDTFSKQMEFRKKSNKRHFQLLEIMIALFLILVCAIPVIQTYVRVYKEQKTFNQNVDIDHLASLAHARVIEELYQLGANGTPLTDLLGKPFYLKDLDQGFDHLPYEFVYQLSIVKPVRPATREKATQLLLDLNIIAVHKANPKDVRSLVYNYKTYVKREIVQGQNDTDSNDPQDTKGNTPNPSNQPKNQVSKKDVKPRKP